MKIGVLSDTHGYLHPGVYDVFEGVERILHAGDIGNMDVIIGLEAIAPVVAIHGNVDDDRLRQRYPAARALSLAGAGIAIVHDLADWTSGRVQHLFSSLPGGHPDVLVYGHSHVAKLHREGETLLFNPGSAGKARFKSRPSVGLLEIRDDGRLEAEIVPLG